MISLRNVMDADLPIFFEHQCDPIAHTMAAFPPRDREAFMAHWKKILADETAHTQTILLDGEVAGYIASFMLMGQREVGYWLGRAFWGRGIATAALAQFLRFERRRPLHAHVVKDNAGSLRVLQKCGFVIAGEDSHFNEQLGRQIDEVALVLEDRDHGVMGGLMPTITLLAGAPAVGKSSTAKALAARSTRSLHIPVDTLREMVVSGMAWPAGEWSPALIEQISLARSSAMHMAKLYCDAGFDVVIDDFWDPHSQMAEYAQMENESHFKKVLLLPSQAAAELRNRARSGEGGATEYIAEGIRIVYRDLIDVAHALPARGWRVIDTSDMRVAETVDAILSPA